MLSTIPDEKFPQGRPVSPPLANLTLNGLEEYLGKDFLTTRYADDFMVAGKSLEKLKNVALPKISSFLNKSGLNLNLDKTSVYSIEEGFDFLGLNFKEYPDNNRVKSTKKGIFLIKPSSTKVKTFVKEHKNSKSSYNLVLKFNQKLREWAEHYRKATSKKTFSTIHYHLWKALWSMVRKKHRRRSKSWLYKKYFEKVEQNK